MIEQADMLTETDISIVLRVTCSLISNHVISCEKRTKRLF
jgi:hypothetical protein